MLYGNAPSPLKKLPLGSKLTDFTDKPDFSGWLGARKVIVDYKQLKLFQMSILWRAGVAKGSYFKEVNLGEFHEARLRTLLLSENPGLATDYSCMMVDLQHDGKGCENWMIDPPTKTKDRHQCGYQFIMGGYRYLFTVSKQKPRPGVQLSCVKPSGEIIILIEDAKTILRSRAAALRKIGQI